MDSSQASAAVTAELLAEVDSGELTGESAKGFAARGAHLEQALGYALFGGHTKAVLSLAGDCEARVLAPAGSQQTPSGASQSPAPADPTPVQAAPVKEILGLAKQGHWASIAYYVAAKSPGIDEAWASADVDVQQRLCSMAGLVKVRVPKEWRARFLRTGRAGEDVYVESKPWLLPRPQPEEVFSALDGGTLKDGRYRVVMYPVDDDLSEAWLRPKYWDAERRKQVAQLLTTAGETLLCKALKDGQWDLVDWVMKNQPDDGSFQHCLSQVPAEFAAALCGLERQAVINDQFELDRLKTCLDPSGVLRHTWRHGAHAVPKGAKLDAQSLAKVQSLPVADSEALHVKRVLVAEDRKVNQMALQELKSLKARVAEDLYGGTCKVRQSRSTPLQQHRRGRSPGRHWRPPGPSSKKGGAGLAVGMSFKQSLPIAKVTFILPQSPSANLAWQEDLASAGAPSFSWTVLHYAAHAGQIEVLQELLKSDANPDDQDLHGLTPFAVAAIANRWEAADVLLESGCCVDGRSKAVVEAIAASGSEGSLHAKELLPQLLGRSNRFRARSLAEYFRWQVAGEVVHGLHPRRWTVTDVALESADGARKILTKAMTFTMSNSKTLESIIVCFAELSSEGFQRAVADEMLVLTGLRIVEEDHLESEHAVALAVDASMVARAGSKGEISLRPGGQAPLGPLAGMVPLLARCLPLGSLSVSSCTGCCGAPIGDVEVVLDGVRLGRTPASGFLELQVPARPLRICPELYGKRLKEEEVEGSPDAQIQLAVPVDIYIYVTLVDEEKEMEFVFVCGHSGHIDSDAKAFVGDVTWKGGKTTMSQLSPLSIRGGGCLELLQSLRFSPRLPEGRVFEEVEWEDTEACQFQRCFGAPVRVGAIKKAASDSESASVAQSEFEAPTASTSGTSPSTHEE